MEKQINRQQWKKKSIAREYNIGFAENGKKPSVKWKASPINLEVFDSQSQTNNQLACTFWYSLKAYFD